MFHLQGFKPHNAASQGDSIVPRHIGLARRAQRAHAPLHDPMTSKRSSMFTVPLPPGGAMSGGHVPGRPSGTEGGHGPQPLITTTRSSTSTVPSPLMSVASGSSNAPMDGGLR